MQYAVIRQSILQPKSINIAGYKHAATVVLAACVLFPDTAITLQNVPNISDMRVMSAIINKLGGHAILKNHILVLSTKNIKKCVVPEKLSRDIHGALYFLPTVLGRLGKVVLGDCGGCKISERTTIGYRPIAHMLSVLKKFGATFSCQNKNIVGHSAGFKGCTIDIMDYSDSREILTGPLVSGATKTAILAAACAKGKTIIHNPYPKPDVTELILFLKTLDYQISFRKKWLTITPPSSPQAVPRRCRYNLMSDISEVMTYITIAISHKIPLVLKNITIKKVKDGLKAEIDYLKKMGIVLQFKHQSLKVPVARMIKPTNIDVQSIGIYSDHQPFFALLLLQAKGKSIIREFVWKKRFDYAHELLKLGFKLQVNHNTLNIFGKSTIKKRAVQISASDLRAAAVLLIAATLVPGKTMLTGLEHLARGYDNFIKTLISLGANIQVNDNEHAISTQ